MKLLNGADGLPWTDFAPAGAAFHYDGVSELLKLRGRWSLFTQNGVDIMTAACNPMIDKDGA
ncbi:hypothetical protein [Janthinobacterium sp. 1_2014MBL_MicDiv]|uniref:hypothetical protein n=1 Tax=Janthinobacterium sp. 1_2014MBL_MicDiv TaxID=1644131 RepID=UPI0012EBFCE7|nr:hypothetical protein [Janthinobacterium sp. 1_2014MBL_MicDiv]